MEYIIYLWAIFLIFGLAISQILHIFSLPANWVALGLLVLWHWAYPESLTWNFILIMTALAALAEVLEFFLQARYSTQFGATRRGNIGGIIGAICGAILCAPLFMGFGALLGALGGAYTGCLLVELPGRTTQEAMHAAKGAFFGKALGFTVKTALGACIVVTGIIQIWP